MPARKKTTATKKKVAVKKPKAKKRVSTKEPTAIIKRKKRTASRTRTDRKAARAGRKRGEAKGETKAKARSSKSADEAKLIEKVAGLLKKGKSVKDIAEILGVSFSKAKRLVMAAQLKPKDRIVGNTAEIGATIVKLRKEGVSWPQIRVRTGLGGATVRRLYEESSGKDWRDSGATRSTAKKTTGRKKASAVKGTKRDRTRKGTAKKTRVKKGRTRKSTSEALSEANEAAATKGSRAKKAGRPKGRRALRDQNAQVLRDVIWDHDSSNADVKAALKGKTITIEREGLRSQDVKVKAVKDVKVSTRMGRMVEFTDADGKSRFVASREITGIRG